MFNLNAVFQGVAAGLQETLVGAILSFISSIFGAILPGFFQGS